jgi:hypothetical protein
MTEFDWQNALIELTYDRDRWKMLAKRLKDSADKVLNACDARAYVKGPTPRDIALQNLSNILALFEEETKNDKSK